MNLRRRITLLLLCLLAGAAIGAAGQWLTGSAWGYLAIPALMAAAWLVVADPERCLRSDVPVAPPRSGDHDIAAPSEAQPPSAQIRH
ncbi:MAG: hypothetical protein IPM15_17655 [Betaproteobacteria bacterium]|jgi:hypothetical protein|nr:hypothetical protein [Betaproteobacteria bacterium]MCC6246938.1 hypothetical protein [Rubrivivax sp.]